MQPRSRHQPGGRRRRPELVSANPRARWSGLLMRPALGHDVSSRSSVDPRHSPANRGWRHAGRDPAGLSATMTTPVGRYQGSGTGMQIGLGDHERLGER